MTLQDIFKSNFLDNVTAVTFLDMVIALAFSFAIGVLIFFVYKKSNKSVTFSSSFSLLLITLPMITTIVILAITSNVVLSLGMVGALSIVRFRTAIKEPMDVVYLFWAIGVGIVVAAGLVPLALFGSVAVGIVMIIFANKNSYNNPYIVVVNCNGDDTEKQVEKFLNDNVKKSIIKSKTVANDEIELHYEVKLIDEDTSFINELSKKNDVSNAVLVSYNGKYMG